MLTYNTYMNKHLLPDLSDMVHKYSAPELNIFTDKEYKLWLLQNYPNNIEKYQRIGRILIETSYIVEYTAVFNVMYDIPNFQICKNDEKLTPLFIFIHGEYVYSINRDLGDVVIKILTKNIQNPFTNTYSTWSYITTLISGKIGLYRCLFS